MDDLFAHYEREIVMLRQLCREYAQRYPKVAAQLQLGGEACDDPHVERLIQSVGLLCARVSKRLDDTYPQFTEALLNLLFPHYLKPFPSCAIVRVSTAQAGMGGTDTVQMKRGTILESAPVRDMRCKFRSVYDVGAAAASVIAARFDVLIRPPSAVRLPVGATSSITIELEVPPPRSTSQALPLRLYLDGDQSFCAALRDALFMRSTQAYVQAGDDPWIAVKSLPIAPVGFGVEEALIPSDARSHNAYRVLAEYFAFPEKFNFVDIDIAMLRALVAADCQHIKLHLALSHIRADSDEARMLAGLSAHNLVQGCTPVVNLFSQPGVPIAYSQYKAAYTVVAHPTHAAAFEVWSVDTVHLLEPHGMKLVTTEFRPYYSLRHGEANAQRGRYWLLRYDTALALCSPGHETSITLVDAACEPMVMERSTLSIEITCTNRDLPCQLQCGAPEGDLAIPGAAGSGTMHFLRRPTRPYRLNNGRAAQWRLISHLALNHHSLAQEGLEGLREMLTLYDLPQSPVSQRQIAGIVGLEHEQATAWIRHKRGASLAYGIAVRLTVEEEAFAGAGLHLFAQVIEQYLALYVQINSFVELVIVSARSGREVYRCKPRSGTMNVL